MSAAKKATTEIAAETTTIDAALAAAMVEIPAKICVQIGQRKRYFGDTVDAEGKVTTGRENALAALKEFTDRRDKPAGTSTRVFLTKEQKEARAAQRAVLLTYAEKQGKEGKNAAAMANQLEDLLANIPAAFDLIVEYNSREVAEPAVQTDTTEQSETEVQTGETVDPLSEFNM